MKLFPYVMLFLSLWLFSIDSYGACRKKGRKIVCATYKNSADRFIRMSTNQPSRKKKAKIASKTGAVIELKITRHYYTVSNSDSGPIEKEPKSTRRTK